MTNCDACGRLIAGSPVNKQDEYPLCYKCYDELKYLKQAPNVRNVTDEEELKGYPAWAREGLRTRRLTTVTFSGKDPFTLFPPMNCDRCGREIYGEPANKRDDYPLCRKCLDEFRLMDKSAKKIKKKEKQTFGPEFSFFDDLPDDTDERINEDYPRQMIPICSAIKEKMKEEIHTPQAQPDLAEIYGLYRKNIPDQDIKNLYKRRPGFYIIETAADPFKKYPVLYYPINIETPDKFLNNGGFKGLFYHDLRQLFGKDVLVEKYTWYLVNEIGSVFSESGQIYPEISEHRTASYSMQSIKESRGETAVKADDGKNPLDLLPTVALESVGLVLQHGAKKYAAHNWRKGMKYSRLISALLRHVFAFMRGENIDPESNLPHMAHAACCVLFLLDYQLTSVGEDDRYTDPIGDKAFRSVLPVNPTL